jgi:hypothetical protein
VSKDKTPAERFELRCFYDLREASRVRRGRKVIIKNGKFVAQRTRRWFQVNPVNSGENR